MNPLATAPRHRPYRREGKLLSWLVGVALCGGVGAGDVPLVRAQTTAPEPIRLSFSTGAIGDINPNDAKASVIAWGRAVLELRGLRANVLPSIYADPEELFRALQQGQIDGTAMLTDEYFRRPPGLAPDFVFLTLRQEMEAAIATLHETEAGRQALTVFQGDRLVKYPLACLKSSHDLLAAAARVRSAAKDPAAGSGPLEATR